MHGYARRDRDRQRQTKSVLVLALSSAMVRPAKACVSCMRASSSVLVRIVVSVSSMLARASCAFIRVLPSACQLCTSGVWNLLTLACQEQRGARERAGAWLALQGNTASHASTESWTTRSLPAL